MMPAAVSADFETFSTVNTDSGRSEDSDSENERTILGELSERMAMTVERVWRRYAMASSYQESRTSSSSVAITTKFPGVFFWGNGAFLRNSSSAATMGGAFRPFPTFRTPFHQFPSFFAPEAASNRGQRNAYG